jgi:hypothetical protein
VRSSGGARGCVVEHRQFLHRSAVRRGGRRQWSRRAAGQGPTFWGRHGWVGVAPLWGLFVPLAWSRAFRFGEASFRVPYNTALEPSRPTVRVLFCRCGARLSASR